MNDLLIFAGTSNPTLSNKISDDVCSLLIDYSVCGKIFHHTFPSGEKYCQFKQNIRGKDVFLIQSPTVTSTNDSFMELLIMVDAAKRASASRITAVLPMSFYTRQDRKDKSRVPISSRLCLDLLETSGVDRILTMDLHAEQIAGFTNLPFDHLMFDPVFIKYIQNTTKNTDAKKLFLMAPDAGALKRVERYAKKLNCDLGFISKRRIDDHTVELQSIVGNVKGKNVIIIDDLTESFGTLKQAAEVCKSKGANTVKCSITHACITEKGINRIIDLFSNDTIDEFIYSDSIENKNLNSLANDDIYKNKLTQLSVSELFANAIINTHTNSSISDLF